MNAKELPDKQLYTLVRSKELSPHLKKIVEEEFKRREFSIEQLDKLAMEYEGDLRQNNSSLSVLGKVLIVLVPFFPIIHAILANRHISAGNSRKWKQHWRFVTIGYAFWTVIVILLARFYFLRDS